MNGIWLVYAGAMLISLLGLMHGETAHASDNDKAVGKAAEQFYSALNTMFTGDLEPMKEVWSHEDDVTCMGPGGGFQVGWEQVLAQWQTQAAMKLGGEVKPKEMRITLAETSPS